MAIFMAFCAYLVIVLLCLLFIRPFFYWQADGNAEIASYGISYLRICMLLSVGTMMQWVFDRLIIATGKSMFFLATLATASVVNLILDPILIFGYLGFPEMETAGAAVATVIGQFCGAFLGILLNLKYNKEIPICFTIRVKVSMIYDILHVGVPTFIMQGMVSFMGVIMNTILYGFSATAVAVYGVSTKIQNLAIIPVHGIDNGLIPIVAYNYGAEKIDRVKESIRWSMIFSFALMSILTILLELFPGQILTLFDASENMLAIGKPAIRILAISYLLSIPGFVLSTTFQGLGNGRYSMYVTLARQVVLPVVFAVLLSRTGSMQMIWYGFIAAELLTIPFAGYLFKRLEVQFVGNKDCQRK